MADDFDPIQAGAVAVQDAPQFDPVAAGAVPVAPPSAPSGYVGRGEFAPEAAAAPIVSSQPQDPLALVAKGVLGAVGSMIPKSFEDLKQMTTLPRPSDVENQSKQSEELGAVWRGERGLEAQAGGIAGSLLQAAPLFHLPFSESPLRPTPRDLALVEKFRPKLTESLFGNPDAQVQAPLTESLFGKQEVQPEQSQLLQKVNEGLAAGEQPSSVSQGTETTTSQPLTKELTPAAETPTTVGAPTATRQAEVSPVTGERGAFADVFAERASQTPEEFLQSQSEPERRAGTEADQLYQHKVAVKEALRGGDPVPVSNVEHYGLEVPSGYVKEGDQYVFKPSPVSEGGAGTQAPVSKESGVETPTAVSETTTGGQAATNEPPEAATTAEASPQVKVAAPEAGQPSEVGISRARTEAELGVGSVEPGVGAEMGSGMDYGRDYLNKGGDPRLPIRRAQASGLVGKNEVGIVHAELERLRGERSTAAKALEANPSDPVLQDNFSRADDAQRAWRKELQPVLTKASDALREAYAQSVPDADPSTYQGLADLFDEHFKGQRDITPKMRTAMTKAAKGVETVRAEANGEFAKIEQTLTNRIKGKKVMTPGELDADLKSELETLFKDCVLRS